MGRTSQWCHNLLLTPPVLKGTFKVTVVDWHTEHTHRKIRVHELLCSHVTQDTLKQQQVTSNTFNTFSRPACKLAQQCKACLHLCRWMPSRKKSLLLSTHGITLGLILSYFVTPFVHKLSWRTTRRFLLSLRAPALCLVYFCSYFLWVNQWPITIPV